MIGFAVGPTAAPARLAGRVPEGQPEHVVAVGERVDSSEEESRSERSASFSLSGPVRIAGGQLPSAPQRAPVLEITRAPTRHRDAIAVSGSAERNAAQGTLPIEFWA